MRRSLFENYEPALVRPARLLPNFYARLTQFCVAYAWAFVISWTVLTIACGTFTITHLNFNSLQHLTFQNRSKTAQYMARFEENFPNLYGMSNLTLSSKNTENLKLARRDLQAKLEDRSDLYSTVLSPGEGSYYDIYGMLYLSVEQVKAHVEYALALHPLFQAIAEQPTADSLSTLVNQVSASIELGRDPQMMDDLFKEAAKSTQSLMKGIERPVDWTVIAGLNADPSPNEAHFVVVPRPGRNEAAAEFLKASATQVLPQTANQSDKVSIFAEMGDGANKSEPQVLPTPNIIPLLVLAGVLIAFVYFAILGQLGLIAMLASPPIVTLSVASALFTLLLRDTALSFWLLTLGLALGTLHFSARLTFASLQANTAARTKTSALMLAAQKQGRVVLWLWPVIVAPWAGWALTGESTYVALVLVTVLSLLVGCLASLTLVPAIASLTPGGMKWTAAEWLLPLYHGFSNRKIWQFMARGLAMISLVAACTGFWAAPSLLPKNASGNSTAEKPVYVLAENQSEVDRILTQLKTLPEAEKVQWLGTFLPSQFAEKQKDLAMLKDQFSSITPLQPQDPDVLRDQITTLQESLKSIANSPSTRPTLAAAANEFRQSLALLSSTGNDKDIEVFEKRMFGAFNVLSQRAEALAALNPPDMQALDARLKSLFVSNQNLFRLTVTAKTGVSQTQLATKLAEMGLSVVSPTLVIQSSGAQTLRSSLIILLAAVSFGVLTVAVGVRDVKQVLVCAITTAIVVGVCAVMAVEQHLTAAPVPLLLLCMALSHGFALCAKTSLKMPVTEGAVPEAIPATESWVIPLSAMALVLPVVLITTGPQTTPLIQLSAVLCLVSAICGLWVQPLTRWLQG